MFLVRTQPESDSQRRLRFSSSEVERQFETLVVLRAVRRGSTDPFLTRCASSPTAEATGPNPVKSGFESQGAHRYCTSPHPCLVGPGVQYIRRLSPTAEVMRLERIQSRFESERRYRPCYPNGRGSSLRGCTVSVRIRRGAPEVRRWHRSPQRTQGLRL